MISSAVVLNQQKAFTTAIKIVPLLDSVLLNNVIAAASKRLAGSERIQSMAKALLTTIKNETDGAIVLPLLTQQICNSPIGRPFLLQLVVPICEEIQHRRQNLVVRYNIS